MNSLLARIGQSHPNQLPGLSSAVVIVILVLSLQLQTSDCLECHCSACPPPNHASLMIWGSCTTNGTCFIKVSNSLSSSFDGAGNVIQRGCVAEKLVDAFCRSGESGSKVVCCHSNRCNGNLHLWEEGGNEWSGRRRLLQLHEDVSITMVEGYDSQKTITIATVVVCVFIVTAIIALVITLAMCYLYFHHGSRGSRREGDLETGRRHMVIGNCCSAIVPQGETLSSLLLASRRSGCSSSSLSLLVQRAIVRSVVLDRSISRGHFSESYVGRWRRERVMVKTYPHAHERMWYTETLLHQIPHMNHAHISMFIAADYRRQSPSVLRQYLITEYYERGTLFEYLSRVTLDTAAVVILAQSAASGLAHLHTEVRTGGRGGVEKASIVHRNISSSCFWVKNDGTCCLGDLSLAIKEDSHFSSELKSKPLGHTHYLSPELLEGDARLHENMTFDLLKKADVYAFGLVMWEIARRCYIHGSVETAELPYAAVMSTERAVGKPTQTSLEQMRMAVLSRRLRPPLAEIWTLDDRMQSYVRLFIECWADEATLRPSTMTTKDSLDKLLPATLRRDQKAKANSKIACED